jgi:hypothetical protein
MTPKQFAACFRYLNLRDNSVVFFDARAIDASDMAEALSNTNLIPQNTILIPLVPRCEHLELKDAIYEMTDEQLKEAGLKRIA